MSRTEFFVGIDVSKKRLDVDLRPGGETFSVDNQSRGHEELVKRLKALKPALIVIEASGGLQTLVCGALSRSLEDRLVASGIELISEIRGEVPEVVRAALDGSLMQPCFLLPGAHSRRRRGRARQASAAEVS